ncbi:S1 family peptidase [Microtetraspora malaysiensis]|uniref:S1 family peptidase n=1 Tax=Microtetraspora malaysiensis TaxID=161358 RepID=UPI003D8CD159
MIFDIDHDIVGRKRVRSPIIKQVRRGKLLTLFALPALALSSLIVPSSASASADPENVMTLASEHQPRVARPTLDRIKATAAREGVPLEKAIASYIANEARTNPAATANWPDGPVDIPDVMIDDLSASQINDLEGMAESEQIPLEEAIDRYGYGRYTTRAGNQITAAFPEELSGFVVEDGGGAWIGFKGAIPSQAVALAKTLPGRVELHGNLGYSEADLSQAKERVDQALQSKPDVESFVTGYDHRLGAVNARVVLSSRVRGALADSKLQTAVASAVANPAIKINVSLGEGPLSSNFDQYIRGGGNLLSGCTSNFNLISETGTTKRLGTAGHCNDQTTTYCNQTGDGDCTTVTLKWSYRGSGGDVGMYDHGTLTATRTFYWDWGQKKYADLASAKPQVGDPVCKFGFKTGRSCGKVTAINQSSYESPGILIGGLVLTDIPIGTDKCWGGDSGGPFHRDGGEAYGVLKGGLEGPDGKWYCSFTPVNRFYNGAKYNVWTR